MRLHTGNQSAVLGGGGRGGASAPANSIGIKTNKERPFYFSVTSKWEARPLRPESIFVVTLKMRQFPLFDKVLLVCVPLPGEQCCGHLPLRTTGKQIPLSITHVNGKLCYAMPVAYLFIGVSKCSLCQDYLEKFYSLHILYI